MRWLSIIIVFNNTSAYVCIYMAFDVRGGCMRFPLRTSLLYSVMVHVHEPYGHKCLFLMHVQRKWRTKQMLIALFLSFHLFLSDLLCA